jgi:hypothetical protein
MTAIVMNTSQRAFGGTSRNNSGDGTRNKSGPSLIATILSGRQNMTTRINGYNGWVNYETWAVNLWLTNEPHSYERLMSIVQNPDTLGEQSEALREWVRPDQGNTWDNDGEGMTSLMAIPVGMYVDLLAAAFDMVHWKDIVRANQEEQA